MKNSLNPLFLKRLLGLQLWQFKQFWTKLLRLVGWAILGCLIVLGLSIGLSGSWPNTSSGMPGQYPQDSPKPILFLDAVAPVYALAPPPSDALPPSPSHPQSSQMFFNAGVEHFQAQRFEEAIAQWQQFLDTYSHTDNDLYLALVSSNLSLAYQHLGKWQEAEDALNQSFSVLGQPPSESSSRREWDYFAKAQNAQGWFYWRRGNPEDAFHSWQKADQAYSEIRYISGVIGSRINQAKALQSLGLNVAAKKKLEHIRQFIETPHADPIRFDVQVMAYQALGNALRQVGELEDAAVVLKRSGAIANKHFADFPSLDHYQVLKSAILLDLANTERALWERAIALNLEDEINDYRDLALEHYRQSVESAPTLLACAKAQANQLRLLIDIWQEDPSSKLPGDSAPGTEIVALWNTLYGEFTNLPLGQSSLDVQFNSVETILKLQAQQTNQEVPEKVLFKPQAIQLQLGNTVSHAYSQAQQLGDKRAESMALGQIGHLYEQAERWEDAEEVTEEAIDLSNSIQALDIQYRWEWQRARILQHLETNANTSSQNISDAAPNPLVDNQSTCFHKVKKEGEKDAVTELLYEDAVLCSYELAVNHLEAVRKDLLFVDSEIQFSFRDNVESLYRQYVDLLLRENEPSQLYLTKATELIDALQLAELENFLGCNLDPLKLDEVDIDAHAAVIYPVISDNKINVVLSLPEKSKKLYRAEVKKHDLEEVIANINDLLPNPPKRDKKIKSEMQKLYDWLIRPLEVDINNQDLLDQSLSQVNGTPEIKTLVFVLDEGLRNIPMGVLWDSDKGQYLVQKYAIAVAPSLSLVKPEPLSRPINILAAGTTLNLPQPFKKANFSAITSAKDQLETIEKRFSSKILLDTDFNQKNLEIQLATGRFSMVHLASHGIFQSDRSRTFIAIHPDPTDEENKDNTEKKLDRKEYALFAQELDTLLRTRNTNDRAVELLVLSACQTAEGDRRATLGIAGLSVQAGVRSTLATLWPVYENPTKAFIDAFYEQLANHPDISRADALRQTQLSFLSSEDKKLNHPAHWGAFVLVGNWL